jgi:aconitase A
MEAIITTHISPKGLRASRIKAATYDRRDSITLEYDVSKNSIGNHQAAARALVEKLGWKGTWVSNHAGKGHAWVRVDYHDDSFAI